MKKINIPMIRLRAQQLISPDFTEVKDVVAWMGAIQAQQPRMAKLALGIRTRGATMQQSKPSTVERFFAPTYYALHGIM